MPDASEREPSGRPISLSAQGTLQVPAEPIIPFIEGDGCGPDVWGAASRTIEAAVARAYGHERRIAWHEVLAGEKAFGATGEWLPEASLAAFRRYLVGIKGPLSTPTGVGIRSLNVALRQKLDLYAAVRPIRWLPGAPSPVRAPEQVDVLIFRENVEDAPAGVEWPAGREEAKRVIRFLQDEMGVRSLRFPDTSAIGIKATSRQGVERLVRAAIEHSLTRGRKSLALVHKGNIMKFTEGAFKDWAYQLARAEFRELVITEREARVLDARARDASLDVGALARLLEPGYERFASDKQAVLRAEVDAAVEFGDSLPTEEREGLLLIRDVLVDAALQQLLTRPAAFDVIATLNLNGDYLADALAAQVGGSAMVPGASLNYVTGHALFEAQHGSAPGHATRDTANPTSLMLCGEMLLTHLGWVEAADRIVRGLKGAIASQTVTGDLAAGMDNVEPIGCAAFADAVIEHMEEGPPTVPRDGEDG